MLVILLVFVVSVFLVLPGCLIAFCPRRYLLPAVAWVLAPVGLLWLAEHVTSFFEKNDRLQSSTIIGLLGLVLAGITIAKVGFEVSRSDDQRPKLAGLAQQLWAAPPLGFIFGVFFLHWLSNRLAGFQPAVLAHLTILACSVIAAGAAILLWTRSRQYRSLAVLGMAFPMTVGLLVLDDAKRAHDHAESARDFAAGAPYCLLNAYGYRWKPATSWLDLSPLVMRDHGRYGIDSGYWLIIRRDGMLQRYGWQRRNYQYSFTEFDGPNPSVIECDPA